MTFAARILLPSLTLTLTGSPAEMSARVPQQYLWGYDRYKVPAGAPAVPVGTA